MKTHHSNRLPLKIFSLVALSLSVLGCVLGQYYYPINLPSPSIPSATWTDLPTRTITPQPQVSIRLMAYNIWLGAGVNPGHAERGGNVDRLADLVTVVKQANPDILGLEELNEWNTGNPAIVEQFASAVGMQYYLAPTWRGFDLAIFSRFPILEAENISEYVGNNGSLRAVVQIPDGPKLNVVIVHLDPIDQTLRTCEFDKLRHSMASYQDQPSILMGDINSYPNSPDTQHLTNGGLQLVNTKLIDSIFVFSHQAWSAQPICFERGDSTSDCVGALGISDHLPVGAVLSFYSFPNPVILPTPIPESTPMAPFPDLSTLLNGVRVVSVTDNTDLPGCYSALSIQQFLKPDQAALLHFRIFGFDTASSKLSINFDSDLADQADFLRYGLGGGGGGSLSLIPYTLTSAGNGSPPSRKGSLTLKAGQWYYLLISSDKNGEFRSLLWNSSNPTVRMEVNKPSDPAWVRDQWKLTIEGVGGQVEMDQFQLLSFESYP